MQETMRKFGFLFFVVFFFFMNLETLFAADAVLTWDPNSESDLAGYKVYVGTASQGYNPPIDVGNVTTWTVTGLSVGTTYSFAVTAYNLSGSESDFSNEVSKTFSSAPDTAPPAISSVNADGITPHGATVTWGTDEPADTQVQYGPTPAYGASTALNAAMATAHSQTLASLQPGTLYHYRVLSRDAAGNLATSADHTFTTASDADTTSPSIPSALTATASSPSQIDLTWNASADNVGVAGYRIYRGGVQIGTSVDPVYEDTGLSPSTTYSYTVSAIDAAGNASSPSTAASAATWASPTGTTVRLTPASDTFLKVDDSVNSAEPTLNTYTWPAQRIANAILMKFDLSGIPSGAVVQHATLHLALVESDALAAPTYTITVHKVINKNTDLSRATGNTYDGVNPWSANACCYQDIPLAQGDISPAYDTQAVDKTPGYKNWNVTNLVQEWQAAPDGNDGLMVNSDPTQPADAYRFFASMEAPDTSVRPYLTVTYTLSGGAASSTQTDTAPPAAAVDSPAEGAAVRGTIPVQGTVSDNVAVVKVEYVVDGAVQATQEGADMGGVSWSWDTTSIADGDHQLLIRAYDAAGLSGPSPTISVGVDNTPPSTPGAPTTTSVQQNQVSFSWPASTDANALAGYQVFRDGTALGTTTAAAYTDTGLASNTRYTYTVSAIDRVGNPSPGSSPLTVTTLSPETTGPAISNITAGNISRGRATIRWDTDRPATSQVEYGRTTSYGRSTTIDTTLKNGHSRTLAELRRNTLYHYRVKSKDAAGNLTVSEDRTFRTN